MRPRIITAVEARALLKGTTPGPWVSERIHDDFHGWTYLISGSGFEVARIVDGQGSEEIHDKAIIEASIDLAHTVIAQAAEITRLRAIVDSVRAERETRVAWLESQPRDVGNGPVPDALLPLLEAELRTGLSIEELDEFDAQKGGAK